MTIPIKYRKSRDNVLASFDSIDLAEGTGIVEYKAASTTADTTADHYMTRNDTYSDEIYTFGATASTSFTQLLDIDFDVNFQLPRTIADATMYATVAIGIGTSGNDQTNHAYIIVKLRKFSGGAESEIANSQSRLFNRPSGVGDTPKSGIVAVSIPTGGRIHFKKGDILRVTIEIWGKRSGGSANSADFAIGHDPKNRNDPRASSGAAKIFEDDKDTITKFWIPFVVTT